MTDEMKETLHHYLRQGREAVLWKLQGLSEYDQRRPLVPTGTNLLGLVKHLAYMESDYFGHILGRPFPEQWHDLDDDAEPNADMWARADESPGDITGFYRRACAHADTTIAGLGLDATGVVPWWPPERREVTLHLLLAHMIAETHRHAGHADLVRELIDGSAGLRPDNSNLPGFADGYVEKLEAVARATSPR